MVAATADIAGNVGAAMPGRAAHRGAASKSVELLAGEVSWGAATGTAALGRVVTPARTEAHVRRATRGMAWIVFIGIAPVEGAATRELIIGAARRQTALSGVAADSGVSTRLSVPSCGQQKKQLLGLNAKSTGKPSAAPLTLVGLEFFTWKNLLGLLGCVGLGWNGRIQQNCGSGWATRVMRLIWISSMPPPPSPWVTEGRHLFGMRRG